MHDLITINYYIQFSSKFPPISNRSCFVFSPVRGATPAAKKHGIATSFWQLEEELILL